MIKWLRKLFKTDKRTDLEIAWEAKVAKAKKSREGREPKEVDAKRDVDHPQAMEIIK